MSFYRGPIDRNPGFPPRSPSPPQFPQYSLWGNSSNFGTNMYAPAHQPSQRQIYPTRADDGPRPSPRTSGREEQRSMTFRRPGEYTRSPNQSIQFTEGQPQRNQPQLWHNGSQYDEQRFSASPQRPDKYCMPFQPAMGFSEEPRPLMAMHMQRPSFLSPMGRSNEYCGSPFQPSEQYGRDAHQFMMQTESPQHQFPSQRSDEAIRSPFPAYNGFMRYDGEQQPLVPQSHSYGLRSPLQRHEHARSPFEASKWNGSSRDYDKEGSQPLMPQTPSFRLRSPLPDEQRDSWSQFQPSEQHYNSINHSEDPSHARSLPESSLQLNTQHAEDAPKILIPCNKKSHDQETEEIMEEEPQPETRIEDEKEVTVIEKKSLYLHPDNFQFDESCLDEIDDPSPEPQEQASTSSGSSGEWTRNIFDREGAPSSQSHRSILSSGVQPRGQRTSALNKRLVKALSQPVRLDKGAKMMQRMGWIGGGLGKDGSGIVDPIAPNAIYATTNKGFGQEILTIQRLPTKREKSSPCLKRNKNKKTHQNAFKINVLLNLLKFVTNDLQVELYFEALLSSTERKRIHKIVDAVGNQDSNMQFGDHLRIVEVIRKRCPFTLKTVSDGEGEQRKICVYKEAPDDIFLVTPEDCEAEASLSDIIVIEDEPNPFLKSIKKHGHTTDDPTSTSPSSAPSDLINKLCGFFLEFCEDEACKEFRFLGPFNPQEITVINNFFTLVEDLSSRRQPSHSIPPELLAVFSGDNAFQTNKNPNGFASIKKFHFSLKEEYKKVIEIE